MSYAYTSTVASKIFNFAPALSNLNVSEYLSNPQTCQCKESKFCFEPHGHVITGDLRIIENARLRELVAKGPKYREPNRVNWKATETLFLESIDLYAKRWSKREQVDLKYLSEWKDHLKELVTDRISNLKGHFKSPKCKVLDQPDVRDTLHKLQTSHNGVNNMWILRNSTSLLSSLDQLDVHTATSVQTFDFSTLYTSIPHDLLKSRVSNLVHNAFRKKDGSVRYTHIKVTRAQGHFTHDINGGGDNMYTADNICKMIEFLIDTIFVQFGGCLFRQVIGIPMGTNCAPLLADLFLYSYENEFLDNMIKSGHRRLARSFNLCYRYIDGLIAFNNKKFLDYLEEIYASELTVEKANKSDHLAGYLDLTFIIDSGGKLSTRLYDKRDDFDFHIGNFPFLSRNIPSGPSYGVYISQLIRYARCCSHYEDFRYCHKCLVDRLLSQGYRALSLEP